jgi:16S rRNA (guanine(966)-N(2))-methyltransferase RsmD
VPGEGTRPITDRAKEALFSILGPTVEGARVLDVFAGTGSVGIEALSRGAAWCDFVDQAPDALRTVRENLSRTGFSSRAGVHRGDAFAWLARLPRSAYDLVYVAPPQYREMWIRSLQAIAGNPCLVAPGGLVVVQIDPREERSEALAAFAVVDRRRYGDVLLLFLAAPQSETTPPGGESEHQ